MRLHDAVGLKTKRAAARPAFGNALEDKIETVLAALARSVEDASARANMGEYADQSRGFLDSTARLGGACAALVSAAARLNGEFKHEIQVSHLHGYIAEDLEPGDIDRDEPMFTPEELRRFTPEDLMREIPLREAAYWSRKAAEVLAATPGVPAPLRAPAPVSISTLSAPARSAVFSAAAPAAEESVSERSGGPFARPTDRERAEGGADIKRALHPALAAFEAKLAAIEEQDDQPNAENH